MRTTSLALASPTFTVSVTSTKPSHTAGSRTMSFASMASSTPRAISSRVSASPLAMGVSSVPDGTGFFRNRIFILTGGERHGLIAGLGGKPAPFKHLGLAPADAAFFGESELDLGVVYRTLKDVVVKIAGHDRDGNG